MNETRNNMQPENNSSSRVPFWGTITLSVLALLVYAYFSFFLLQLPKTPVIYIALAVFLFSCVSAVTSVVLTISGRQGPAMKLGFYTLHMMGISVIAVLQGRALTTSLSILVISLIAILYLLPRPSRRWYAVVTAVGIIVMWTLESINLPWRVEIGAARIAPVAVTVFVVILGWIVFTHSRQFLAASIATSLRLQITVWTAAIVAVLSTAILTYTVLTSRQAAIDSAQAETLAVAANQAGSVKGQIDPAFSAARTMAYTLRAGKESTDPTPLTRQQVNGMLKKVAEENPTFLGTWTLWEPNAFDGQDANYVNAPLHDATGRFIPYWVRSGDTVEGVAIVDYETPTPGLNDWYFIPRATQKETLITPYLYPVDGVDVLMTTISIPVIENGQFYGVIGVDYRVDFLQGIVDEINLYNGTASAVLFTDTGTVIAVRNQPELTLQPASVIYEDFEQIQSRMADGETFISLSSDKQYLRVFSPIDTGEAGRWWFSLVVPFSAITAPATASAVRESAISLGIIVLSLMVLWYLTGQLVRPIVNLTSVANAVSGGDLNATASVETANEIGILASTFNSMTTQLRETLFTLEQRVADRTRNLELAAEVGRAVSQVRALEDMLRDACELILKEFNLYYVQVYLADANGSTLKLEAGTGNVGAQLVGRGHSLPFDSSSINGRAAVEKRAVVISDTAKSTAFRKNPLLPDTRGEMAVPLIVAGKVVGVLDMQSSQAGVLNNEILPAFETLAGQLAIAVQNANLLAETEQARAEVEKQARRLVRASWSEHLDAIHKPEQIGYVFDRKEVRPLAEPAELQTDQNSDVISSSISVTGEHLGSLVIEMSENSRTEQAAELVSAVSRQVAQQIENLRLLDSAERYRQEAEQVLRRQTRENWQQFLGAEDQSTLSYRYDLNEVRPYHNGHEANESSYTFPLKVRDEAIGKLSIQGLSNDDESINLINAVADRLTAHIEGLRQTNQTQSALAQSEKLFDASRSLTQSTDLQELVNSAVTSLNISSINRAILVAFDYDTVGNLEGLDVIANWWNGTGTQATQVGTHYPLEVIRVMRMFLSPTPVFFNDAFNDERVDANTMQLVQQLNLRAVAVLPLHTGTTQLGALILEAEEPHNFTTEETRLFTAIAPQIATIVDNRRQFERAQKQAQREATLNVINQKIQSATSVEAVLQIAARELGHALGAPMTIAQLSMKDRSS